MNTYWVSMALEDDCSVALIDAESEAEAFLVARQLVGPGRQLLSFEVPADEKSFLSLPRGRILTADEVALVATVRLGDLS